MARKRRSVWPFAAAALIVGLIIYYIILSAAFLSVETSLQISLDTGQCGEEIQVTVEARDSENMRLPDALIDIYQEGKLVDSLYTDRNGMIEIDAEASCGSENSFKAEYKGDELHLPSSASATAIVKAPSSLQVMIQNQTTPGETVKAEVNLGISGAAVFLEGIENSTDENGTAAFTISFNSTGTKKLNAEFRGNTYFEASDATAEIEVLPLMCDGKLLPGECADSYLCTENLSLEFSCGECGCPAGLLCIDNECITDEERLQMLISKLQQSDVLVESDRGSGSGVIIWTEDGKSMIITNRHVVDPDFTMNAADNIQIFNSEREVAKPQSIQLAPHDIDLAVITIGKYLGPAAELGSNESIERGAEVLAIGSPLGIQDTVSKGIVSNFYETETESEYEYKAIQVDAPVNPGNSGGGLFLSRNGKLIGITTFKLVISKVELAEGLGFAIPISLYWEFPLDEWTAIAP